MILTTNKVFVFDLDDTLYPEYDFEQSGIDFVCDKLYLEKKLIDLILIDKKSWIQSIISNSKMNFTKDYLLSLYNNHFPKIYLYNDANIFLNLLKSKNIEMSIITDGKSITQKNKLKALGIEKYFERIIISEEINSEKPAEINYKMVMNINDNKEYVYIADNPRKDFITPNKLGWTTICLLDRGQNIHQQNFKLSKKYLPKYFITSFNEIILSNEY